MNIAFPAFLFLLLLMPGVLHRRARVPASGFRERRQLADEIGFSVVTAMVLQALWYWGCWLLSGLTGLSVDLRSTVVLLAGRAASSDSGAADAVESVAAYPTAIATYFVTILLAGHASGVIVRYFAYPMRQTKQAVSSWFHGWWPSAWIPHHAGTHRSALQLSESVDPRDDFVEDPSSRRFGQWMRSCELDEEEFPNPRESILFLIVAAVVELGGKPFLYKGSLEKAFFGPDGELERLSLRNVQRRCIKDDESDRASQSVSGDDRQANEHDGFQEYYTVRGDTFILRLSEVKTINFLYYELLPPADEIAATET